VVHRFKTLKSGLVATKVWAWRGRSSSIGELGEAKLEGLARRYGSNLVIDFLKWAMKIRSILMQINVRQGAEPAELVHVLGGRIAIRQGNRSHWSSENTTMHSVRLIDGVMIIDELDLVSL
jgi:hypothetical protein